MLQVQTVGGVDYVLATSFYSYIHLLSISNDKITLNTANQPIRSTKLEITGLTVGTVAGSWLVSGVRYLSEVLLV